MVQSASLSATGESFVTGGCTAYTPPAVNRPIDPAEAVRRTRRRTMIVVGLSSLANGAALVFHILGHLPLPGLLVVTWTVAGTSLLVMAAVGGPAARALIVRLVGVGLAVGLLATATYDVTKTVLSQLDPSPYDPFEATRAFGRALVGETAGSAAVTVSGWAFHFANGCTFAIAYAALFARDGRVSRTRGITTGIGMALLLETFQLALYPGWLNIRFLDEFRQISFASHLVFGLGLGLFIPAGLRWARRREDQTKGGVIHD